MQSQQRQDRPRPSALSLRSLLFGTFLTAKSTPSHPTSPAAWQPWLRGTLLGTCAYLFASTPLLFSVNPLALCLLGAAEQHLGFIALGLCIGAWRHGDHPWLYVAACALLLVLRVALHDLARTSLANPSKGGASVRAIAKQRLARLARQLQELWHSDEASVSREPDEELAPLPTLFADEPLSRRLTLTLLCALIPCIGIPYLGAFAYYDLYGAVLTLILTLPATFAFACALHHDTTKAPPVWQSIGAAVLFCAALFCARDLSLFGLSPVLALLTAQLLCATQRQGILAGWIVSVLGGLAYDVRVLPLLAAIATLHALLSPVLGRLSLLSALLLSALYSLLWGGNTMLLAILPSVAVGLLCFSAWQHLHQGKESGGTATSKNDQQNEREHLLICEQNRNAALCSRLSGVANAFGSLSEVFRQLSDTLSHPGAHEIRHLCDEVCDDYCPQCPHRHVCWSNEYSATGSGIYALSRAIASGKGASADYLPSALRARCPHTAAILGDISYRVSRRTEERAHGADGEVFAQSYDAISCLLRDILHENSAAGNDFCYSKELSNRLAGQLGERGIAPRHVCVSGDRRKTIQIFGISPAALTTTEDELRALVASVCGQAVSKPRYDGADDGTLTLHTLPSLRADFVHRSVAAETANAKSSKSRVCGDSLRLFQSDDGMFYALLCDGMGSGRGAALTSASCAVFLERVLRAGVSVRTALRMLNHYLRDRVVSPEDEYSSTVDLFELDLYTGQGHFYKSGAAPTILLRDGRVYRLAAHTVPIGILQAIDVQTIPFDLAVGDRILLLSDGITDIETKNAKNLSAAGGTGDLLSEFLSGELPSDDEALVNTLIAMAREHGSLDDASVISIRILSCEP